MGTKWRLIYNVIGNTGNRSLSITQYDIEIPQLAYNPPVMISISVIVTCFSRLFKVYNKLFFNIIPLSTVVSTNINPPAALLGLYS